MNIFLSAGGRGMGHDDLIKNKIPRERLKPYAGDLVLTESGYSLWGLSQFGALKPTALKEDDIVFISNHKCLVYIAKIFFCFEGDEIDDIAWYGQKQWKYKVVLKDPIKIFIPDENLTKRTRETIDDNLEEILEENLNEIIKIHGKSEEDLSEIKNLYRKNIGLRHVLSKKDKGNLQGNYQIGSDKIGDKYVDSNEIMDQFSWYCNATKYQCIEMNV